MADDIFFQAYDRHHVAYGSQPSAELDSYLQQVAPRGFAIDLGAGAGRNSLALARAGLKVLAVDTSERGLERLREQAESAGLGARITTSVDDVRLVPMPLDQVTVVVATTVLDHISIDDARILWDRIEHSLTHDGVIYAEVHTIEDPGCGLPPGCNSSYPVSETAGAVQHYFQSGELLRMATRSGALRVLRYEERQEWDYTHGPEHHHGKAILVAVRSGFFPPWYGHPLAFPRQR